MEKSTMKITLFAIMALFSIHAVHGEIQFGQNVSLTVGTKVGDELFLGVRGEAFIGQHLEQIDLVQSAFDSSGLSGTEFALLGRLFLGTVGKAEVSGMAELAIYNRVIADSNLYDGPIITTAAYQQYLPRAGINVRVPVGGGFSFEFNNTFERRLITNPEVYSFWMWQPQMRAVTPNMTGLNLAAYVDYGGSDNKDLYYKASTSFGLKSRPINGLTLDLADKISWKPDLKKTTVHVFTLQVEYAFGSEAID